MRLRRAATVPRLLATLGLALLLAACDPAADFPDPSNPVRAIPWPDYELLRFDFIDENGRDLGTMDLEVERQGSTYLIHILFLLTPSNARDEIFVRVDAETLRPIDYQRSASNAEERIDVSGVYGEETLAAVVIEDGKRQEAEVELGEFAFDNDSSAYLWRSIGFAQDLQVVYRSVNVKERRSQLVRLRVRSQDLVRAPAGEFLTWEVEVVPGLDRQTIWFTVDAPHYLVQWDQPPRRFLLREIVTERPAGR